MGSWDETCAISGLALRDGEPTVEITIKLDPDRKYESRFYFHDSLAFSHIDKIVKGKYYDYGYLHETQVDWETNRERMDAGYEKLFIHQRVWDHALTVCRPNKRHWFLQQLEERDKMDATIAADMIALRP